jgi:hypothetical protein
MNDLILDKYQGLEFNCQKEKNQKENMERKYKELIRKLKDNEENLMNEINFMRENLERKGEEFEGVKLKYENKIQKLKYKVEEFKLKNENLDEIPSNHNSNVANIGHNSNNNFNSQNFNSNSNHNKSLSLLISSNQSVNKYHDSNGIKAMTHISDNLTSNELTHKQTLDNLKNIINQIDDKIGLGAASNFNNFVSPSNNNYSAVNHKNY